MIKQYSIYIFFITLLNFPSMGEEKDIPFENQTLTKSEIKEHNESLKEIRATKKACIKALQKYKLNGANYVEGIDVRGSKVAGAGLVTEKNPFEFPNEIEFDLSLSPFQAAGLGDFNLLFPNSEFSLGKIQYDISKGKLTLNGKSLDLKESETVAELCQQFKNIKQEN